VRKTNLAYNEMLAERMQKEDQLQEEVERLKRMLKSKENAVAGSVSLQERCNQLEEELRGVTEKCNTVRHSSIGPGVRNLLQVSEISFRCKKSPPGVRNLLQV
jgi:uncharacterized coiled-coil protein SlyX